MTKSFNIQQLEHIISQHETHHLRTALLASGELEAGHTGDHL